MYKSSISDKNNISLDNVCYLINTTYEKDVLKQQIEKSEEELAYCAELPVYNSEFFKAAQSGIKAECILAIDYDTYNSQKKVKYNEDIYSIFKVFKRSDGLIELHCEVRSGNKS